MIASNALFFILLVVQGSFILLIISPYQPLAPKKDRLLIDIL
jgi:hypothetical protein